MASKISDFILSDSILGLEFIIAHPDVKTVSVLCSPLNNVKQRIRITRVRNELRINYGRPNYKEREYLKKTYKNKDVPKKLAVFALNKKKK